MAYAAQNEVGPAKSVSKQNADHTAEHGIDADGKVKKVHGQQIVNAAAQNALHKRLL